MLKLHHPTQRLVLSGQCPNSISLAIGLRDDLVIFVELTRGEVGQVSLRLRLNVAQFLEHFEVQFVQREKLLLKVIEFITQSIPQVLPAVELFE